jgi:hypothetical protein
MTKEKKKLMPMDGIYFLIPVFYPKKILKAAYNLQLAFNSFAAYNGLKDVKVLKKKFEPADIQVAMSILLRNKVSKTDIA